MRPIYSTGASLPSLQGPQCLSPSLCLHISWILTTVMSIKRHKSSQKSLKKKSVSSGKKDHTTQSNKQIDCWAEALLTVCWWTRHVGPVAATLSLSLVQHICISVVSCPLAPSQNHCDGHAHKTRGLLLLLHSAIWMNRNGGKGEKKWATGEG